MSNEELCYDFSPMIKVYKDGRVERLLGTATVPPSTTRNPSAIQRHCHLPTTSNIFSEANVVAVSVEYRLAPEHPIPAAYDNSWAALKWVASHFDGKRKGGEEEDEDWITSYADSQRVFFAGDSAGANIAHHMGLKLGSEGAAWC
ncbi:CXE carboxylesterase [Pyrus ussuriensis x Pyrus communis]|uniref:CXE carboxylesterase n=1 Tax=Pyrus ussuriensis x Pyrus communis TaxID=2448454 RepID=A0A5N5IAX4_9ROSA|nr:CXE carboxylesterase [Pyrus ussuriensis x Pyrus communis]